MEHIKKLQRLKIENGKHLTTEIHTVYKDYKKNIKPHRRNNYFIIRFTRAIKCLTKERRFDNR